MKTLLCQIIALIWLSPLPVQPADPCPNSKNAVKYYNGFQHTKTDPAKTNEALYYAQSLARECPATLQSLLHTFFAQAFIKEYTDKQSNSAEKKLLDLFIKDTNHVLVQTAKPIYLWAQVQENENNTAGLVKFASAFLETQFDTSDLHGNRTARYALLIYQLLYNKKDCSQLAQALLHKTNATLKKEIRRYDLPSNAMFNRKRAWYRYLYAYTLFVQAQNAQQQGDLVNAEEYYRMASIYSPDESDKQATPGYDYDKVFLKGKDSFTEEYLTFLASNPDRSKSLAALTQLAIEKPAHIARLEVFYTQQYPHKEPFNKFWEAELNKSLQPAPDFHLQQLNKQPFSLTRHKGKWVLVDFWGTWCEPCIEEMPKMQSFYREVSAKYADKLSIITIACKDTEMKVKTFLNKYKYNFPVALATAEIEKDYAIAAYPTKLLITPQGNVLAISPSNGWVEQVKLYVQLQE
jgi:thiol-disulfide isomerase/thioredoxin